ncbi:HSF-type DNA-binding-domain-containing protein [Mrakia frigida]|uniref:heat shock factor family protein n=1 Tax=Mrakia frigida TaxID=29902 RepID=UPI003FCC1EC3
MLDDSGLEGAIEWKSDSSFIVPDPEYFARVICPQQFKHSNWQSFVRQLNMYGFSKVSSEWQSRPSTSIPPSPPTQQVGDTLGWEFRHPCFIRGQTHLLQQIKRKAVKSADKKPVPSPRASSSSLGPARHDDVHHPHEIYHHHPPTSRKRHSEGDGESMDDLISAAEGASDRLPAPAVPSHSSSSGPHHQHPSHESGQHRISDPWNPPAAALSPTLAAMTDRITALEEGLYHSRMDALQSQRDLARSVLAVMDRHDGDESNEDRKEDSEFSSAFVRRSSETDSISTCSFLSAFSSSSTRGST